MKYGNLIVILAALAAGVAIGWFIGSGCLLADGGTESFVAEKETRTSYVDTLRDKTPAFAEEQMVGAVSYRAKALTQDSGQTRTSGLRPQHSEMCEGISESDAGISESGEGMRIAEANVELPVIQRHYRDSTYEAWVSGPVSPQLDSVRVYARTEVVEREVTRMVGIASRQKRWHVGVTVGYGYGTKGFQPFVGIGLTYSIFSF